MKTSDAPRKMMARKPSHLGSKRKPPAAGKSSASLASMGSSGGAMGNSLALSGVLMFVVHLLDGIPADAALGRYLLAHEHQMPNLSITALLVRRSICRVQGGAMGIANSQ